MLSDQAELTSIYLSDSLVPSIDKYHPPIEFLIKFEKSLFSEHLESPYIFNLKKCKFNEITQFLSNIDFDLNLDNNLSLDAIINKFHEIIYHSFNLFVPKIYNNNSIVWSNAELRNLIIEKKAAHKKYKLFPSLNNYFKFSKLRKKVKLLNLNCHTRYIADIENSISLNIKPFWNYVNSLKKSKNNVPDCMKYNSKTTKNLSETVNLFADYFSSVYVNSTINSNNIFSLPNIPTKNNHINLSSWSIDTCDIFDYLNSLDLFSGTGPDGIPSVLKKNCSSVLLKPLHFIFNKSLSLGYFPDIWKKSFVTPIHKTGDIHNVTNYRPISKMSIIPKMFEALITKKLSKIVSQVICKNQHGFRPNMSINTNILLYQSKILEALNSLNDRVQTQSTPTFKKLLTRFNIIYFLIKYLLLASMEHFLIGYGPI